MCDNDIMREEGAASQDDDTQWWCRRHKLQYGEPLQMSTAVSGKALSLLTGSDDAGVTSCSKLNHCRCQLL